MKQKRLNRNTCFSSALSGSVLKNSSSKDELNVNTISEAVTFELKNKKLKELKDRRYKSPSLILFPEGPQLEET